MPADSPGPSPWYREPLVWMVVAIPAAAVIAGAVMLVLANATWDGLVADDYYERGMQINRSLPATRRRRGSGSKPPSRSRCRGPWRPVFPAWTASPQRWPALDWTCDSPAPAARAPMSKFQ